MLLHGTPHRLFSPAAREGESVRRAHFWSGIAGACHVLVSRLVQCVNLVLFGSARGKEHPDFRALRRRQCSCTGRRTTSSRPRRAKRGTTTLARCPSRSNLTRKEFQPPRKRVLTAYRNRVLTAKRYRRSVLTASPTPRRAKKGTTTLARCPSRSNFS